jgi:phosphomevalonate kinase
VREALSAPGKLVLLGEYAVLHGAPAVVMAVDRRARVELVPSGGERWSVKAPPLARDELPFSVAADGRVHWHGTTGVGPQRLELVDRLIESMAAAGLIDAAAATPAAVTLDTRALFEDGAGGGTKLGLGSSAAATVALASALALWCGRDQLLADRLRWLETLLALHRGLQGGRGSGVDLAASLLGGLVSYRLGEEGTIAAADQLAMPEGLHLVVLWTGRAADTGSMLRQLDARVAEGDRAVETALARLAELSEAGSEAFRPGRVSSLLEIADAFCEAMDALGRAAGLPLISAEHEALRSLARRHGASYKPSGAGGGDLGIALAAEAHAIDATAAAAVEAGFRIVPLHLDRRGLARDPSPPPSEGKAGRE